MPETLTARIANTDTGPDFRHVESWIFDLDNTLYPASSELFAQIDARMTTFVQNLLGLGRDEARALQKSYYRDHGTTLNGLMHLHGVDPEHYLAVVHDIDLTVLAPDPLLTSAIARLPGRRIIFTNGCRNHAARVLSRLALDGLFDEMWDIRTVAWRPKPDEDAYRHVLAQSAIAPERAAMFEDAARNLVPAHRLGMTTVWLRNGSAWSKQGPEHPVAEPAHIHYEIEDLPHFLHSIRI
jgi:putative hydrolase of the HAD superfamily